METLTGTVDRIIYETEDSAFKIFHLKQKSAKKINVKGDFPQLLQGTMIKVHGDYYTHPKYGTGFKAVSCTYTFDNSERSIALYIQSIAKWIGPERSREIAQKFGSDLERVINEEPDKIAEIEGIGSKVVQSLVDAWVDNREMANIRIFLHSLNLPENKIKKIIRKYGVETESVLSENPYLLSFEGFSFATCDFIASKLGLDPSDPLRYRYFILYALRQCLNKGHLYLSKQDILEAFNTFNNNSDLPFDNGRVKISTVSEHLEALEKDAFILKEGDKYYEMESFFFENESARKLNLIRLEPDKSNLKGVDPEKFIKRYQDEQSFGGNKFELSEKQKESIRSFISEKILLVTGTPGTGKTTIVKSFVQLMNEKNVSYELLTPTGISAKKLGDTAGEEAMTIHRRLGYKGKDWDYNSTNKFSTDVVIVDELSMVDMEVFYRLVTALHNTTRLVFVGDHNQLPSVGPGNVLAELIVSEKVKVIHLDKIFRQDECSDIVLAAEKIRKGDTDLSLFMQDKMADIWHIVEKNPAKIEDLIKNFSNQLKNKKKLSFQIFSPRNQGPLSVDTLNVALQNSLNPADPMKKEVQLNRSIIRKGDRILITKNNYNLGVFNGDIGKVVYITPEEVCVDIDDFGNKSKRVSIPMDIADEHLKLAYAITVHKAQGQEYPLIILPFIKAHGKMLLQRNLLYTAITRAKKKVIILGEMSAIERAIMNDTIQKRNTLFAERIATWFEGKGKTLRKIYSNPDSYLNVKSLNRLISLEDS
jgi:exodeoxyribonuclease V alpha subunit